MVRTRRKDQGAVQHICPNKERFSSAPPSFLLPSSQPLTSHQLKPKPALSAQALSEGTETCCEKHKCWGKGSKDFLKLLKKCQLLLNLKYISNENCLGRLYRLLESPFHTSWLVQLFQNPSLPFPNTPLTAAACRTSAREG